jgi:hypothetical protein
MIVIIFVCWAVSSPMGYVIGANFAERVLNKPEDDIYRWVCAILPPVGAILAIVLITYVESDNA